MGSITQRIDAITRIPAEYRSPAPPCPRSVKIELTARCNFACSFCARSQKLRDQGDMKPALLERLLPELRAAGVEEIGLFYLGESFLLPWLAEAVMLAKHIVGFPYVFLTTNGSLAEPAKVGAAIACGLDSLKFSLNYADADQFAAIAGVKRGIFDRVISNLRTTKRVRDLIADRLGHRCSLYASYIQYDGEQARRMEALIAEIAPYVDEIYALPLYNQADLVTPEERRQGWTPSPGNRGRVGALRDPLPCWAVFTEGHITYDGKLWSSMCLVPWSINMTIKSL
ncbi:hypothetical protein LCGC14_2249700 [marine sediment metagenome]|uniref:Radical SAM core domain-containing protein n=1 Tax=marine sediment metagenome TaxID=412755 RepID=A0A0F9D395_9ZZZZ